MPYARNSDLPKPVRDALPAGAQSIYRGAHNSATAKKLPESRAAAIAWAAVKKSYRQDRGRWVKRKS